MVPLANDLAIKLLEMQATWWQIYRSKDARRPRTHHQIKTTHGNFSKDRRERARQFAKHGRQLRAELKELENWFVNHGYLDRNWRAKFQ